MTRTIKPLIPFDLVIPLGECFPVKYQESNLYRNIHSSDIYNSKKLEKAQRFGTWGLTKQTGSSEHLGRSTARRHGLVQGQEKGMCVPGQARREINQLRATQAPASPNKCLVGYFMLIRLSQ